MCLAFGEIFSCTDDKCEYWRGLFESIKKRVIEQDISYMTWEWKNALRAKKKYARMFAKDRTVKNLELKRKPVPKSICFPVLNDIEHIF